MRSLLSILVPTIVGATCLSNAIPAGERQHLENSKGQSYPIGIWIPDWAAGYAANALVAILLEEVFGFNTTEAVGSGTPSAFYATSACADPNNLEEPQCGNDQVARYHVSLESWTSYNPALWTTLHEQYPTVASKNLGNMGYEGVVSTFVPTLDIKKAYQSEGLNLLYFRNWNASWYKPYKYFDSLSMINASKVVKLCSDKTNFLSHDSIMQRHVKWTGDADGVLINNGVYAGRCDDGYWWTAPSCRSNTTECVPWVTGGFGWGIEEYMQKSTIFQIPMAIGVALSWATYTEFPFWHPKSHFYWWIPDPTFLELQPLQMIFPPHDRIAYSKGDMSSATSSVSIDKLVSKDLSLLAPNVESFLSNLKVTMAQMDQVLLDQKNTSDSWRDTMCRWLHANTEVWQSWIPDESRCFPGFGLYDTVLESFTEQRVNTSNKIVCQACASGTFSQALSDSIGETYICVPCPLGTSQDLGAAQFCKPCKSGEYQDEIGSRTCKRCSIGNYQDESGAEICKSCPVDTTTLGLGSVAASDCGCKADHIDVNIDQGVIQCQRCSEGLRCPILSNLVDLQRGASDLGPDYVPQVKAGYFSAVHSPTEVYFCSGSDVCPGGAPGSCTGGLVDTPCAQCTAGSTWTGSACESCGVWRQALWVCAIIGVFVFVMLLYWLTSSHVTAKATVLFAVSASVGMLVMSMQNLGLIGMMTVQWPEDLKGFFSICQFLLLDIDSYGFSCIAGTDATTRYLLSALIFPAAVAWLGLCYGASRLLSERHHWIGPKVCSTMGAFLQMGFSTMAATSLAPMMCYKHPNGLRSLLKYPDVICGSGEHTAMLAIGWTLLIVFVLGFVALCTFAVIRVPQWSSERNHKLVGACRFLIFRFRLDSWWFGVPLLLRGPLLSLPVVLATDYPPVQILMIAMLLTSFLVLQMITWPWKVPMLNLTDCTVSFCVTLLVTSASLHVNIVDSTMIQFAEFMSTLMLSGIAAAMGIMCVMTTSALIYRTALGGKQEIFFFNLGTVPSAEKLAPLCKMMAVKLRDMDVDVLSAKLAALAVFDMRKVTTCITLLATEVAPPNEDAVTFKFDARINSSSFDPSLVKPTVKLQPPNSNLNLPNEEEATGLEPQLAARFPLQSEWV